MSIRIYVPGEWMTLGESIIVNDGLEEPLTGSYAGHAVTGALRASFPELDEEQLEHYAMTEAAQASLGLFYDEGEPMRRLVLAFDVDTVVASPDSLTEVRADGLAIPRDVVAWLADTDEAAGAVNEAVGALALESGTVGEALDRCLDHELASYAAHEVDQVLALRGW